jgi:KDO2-lipid IV(A) lauroyltransferase
MSRFFYFIFYSFFYLISLLPWSVLYFISDGIALLLRKVIKYRVAVVDHNLAIAFPEKSIEERKKIAKEFYQQFTDSFIETIKILSVSSKTFDKRFSSNVEVLNTLYATGQNVQIMAGHFFNWEFANWGVAKYGKYPFIAVYMPLSNKAFNKLIYDLRARYGSIMIPATNFRTQFHKYTSQGPYALALAADQNPGDPLKAFWVSFFGRLTPFVKGPEKGAVLNNTAQVFVHFYRIKRGYYHSEYTVMTTTPKEFKEGELTAMYVKLLQEKIKQHPSNYLWSHKRWKYNYDAALHENLVVK